MDNISSLQRMTRFINGGINGVKILNVDNLQELLINCYRKPNFDAIIMLQYPTDVEKFVEELRSTFNVSGIDGVRQIEYINRSRARVHFYNGSDIEIISSTTGFRGLRYHAALISEDIQDTRLINALGAAIIDYQFINSITGMRATMPLYIDDCIPHETRSGIAEYFRPYRQSSMYSNLDIQEDKACAHAIDEFLDTFKINKAPGIQLGSST